jgi:uncharacterized protein (TIGR03083 family)
MSDPEATTYSLTPERYLALVRADADLLADTAAKLDLAIEVPTCPGWTVRDAVLHTAQVYLHKISCTQFGVQPDPWPPEPWPPADALADPVGFFRRAEGELLTELATRDPASHAATWWPPDQTVGFWCRRMAQETAVHRVDVQSAGGTVTPIDAELAVDGVDELLELMLAGDWSDLAPEEWGDVDPQVGAGRPVDLRTGDRRWRVVATPERVDVSGLRASPIDGPPADATITGQPSDLLLWAWGRRPDSAVTIEGDTRLANALRARLALATQ